MGPAVPTSLVTHLAVHDRSRPCVAPAPPYPPGAPGAASRRSRAGSACVSPRGSIVTRPVRTGARGGWSPGASAPAPTVPARSCLRRPGRPFPSSPCAACYMRAMRGGRPDARDRTGARPSVVPWRGAAGLVRSGPTPRKGPATRKNGFEGPPLSATLRRPWPRSGSPPRRSTTCGRGCADTCGAPGPAHDDRGRLPSRRRSRSSRATSDWTTSRRTRIRRPSSARRICPSRSNVLDLMQKIERALERMDAGTYGICARCGKPIEKARRSGLCPTSICIKDAQAESRR